MSFRKPDYVVTDIDFENEEEDELQFDSHNSHADDVLSQYSNSDLQEFNNLERDIYGSTEDLSSEDRMNTQPLPEDHHTSADEISDSLRLVLPNIQIKPFLGDPIQTYDELRGQYKHEFPAKVKTMSPDISEFSEVTPIEKRECSPRHLRVSSQASNGSAETVLSQNEEIEEPAKLITPPKLKTRTKPSSVSSNDSATHLSSHRSQSKGTQKVLLEQEREIRKDQDKYINHLQHTINQLLTKHALAEETIDQLRLGVVINTQKNSDDQRSQRRTPTAIKKKLASRRYSSILDNANYRDYENAENPLFRAKSVDMDLFDDDAENKGFSQKQHLSTQFGGSMKQIPNSETEIANDIRTIGDYFQSRIKILNEAANNLQYNSSGRASASSGSHNGDSVGKIVNDNQRHTPLSKRLRNLQTAYSDLQSDFNGFRQINKKGAPENGTRKDSGLHHVEGDLFELGMKIDDLERTIAEGGSDNVLEDSRAPFLNGNRDNELISRFTNVEDQYQSLMDRYNGLKGSRSPVRQRQLDDIVQQLQSLVNSANGRYPSIPTPDKLESIMQKDIIDKIKQHMSSDSPPYFLTEEDGLSSGHSSFGRNHRRRYRGPRSDEDSDYKTQTVERLSPIKSRISSHIPDDDRQRYSPLHTTKPNSLPVSVVSSSSMWLGATSGETLALDDQGILRDSMSRKGNSSVGSEVFEFPNKSIEEVLHSRRQSKTNNVFNPRSKSEISNHNFILNHSPLHDDIKRLDEQLEKVELEEKRQISAARDSDATASRHTRSLLGTSPSNSIISKHSRQPSSVASSTHKSQGTSSGHRQYGSEKPMLADKRKRRRRSRPIVAASMSGSDNDTPSDECDIEDYVKGAGCGLGPRSRYVRSKNKNVHDRWSQTPPVFNRQPSSSHLREYDYDYPSDLADPYIDDVAYWDGESFHPSRESIPGKSILRRSSPHSKHRAPGTGHHRPPHNRYMAPLDTDRFQRMMPRPRVPISHYQEPNVSREYYKMDPYRYLVREYGHRMPTFDESMYEEESDYDDSGSPYETYAEKLRLRDYLDEAVKAAQSMKRYTKRISELCEQRKFEDNFSQLLNQRNYGQYYPQYS